MNRNKLIITFAVLILIGAGCTGSGLTPPSGNDRGIWDSMPTNASSLDLSSTRLQKVPSYVFDMTKLEELNLSDNNLTGALPAEIRHLQNLRVLNASGNQMTGVPAEIGQLSKLEELDLSDNQLTGLPLELGNLSNLRVLDLRGNNASAQDLDAIRAKLTNTQILQ